MDSPNIRTPDLLIVEPWFGGSHRRWIEEYRQRSAMQIGLLSLPGRYWKWRMQGGAQTLARQFREQHWQPARVLVSDMLDLPVFLGILRRELHGIPVDLYFHENQVLYPWSALDKVTGSARDNVYGYRNVVSAVAADRVFFNSGWHRRAFLDALPAFLDQFPDRREKQALPALRKKSKALPLGLDLHSLDHLNEPAQNPNDKSGSDPKLRTAPVLLWNHRWEYDKNPALFFDTLIRLKDHFLFRVLVLGQSLGDRQGIFEKAREALQDRILHWGPVSSRSEYAEWLRQADILPVTSSHDFFGASVVEAMYAGCRPILPNHWVYPEHLPESLRHRYCYEGPTQFEPALINALNEFQKDGEHYDPTPVRERLGRFDWSVMAPVYDRIFSTP